MKKENYVYTEKDIYVGLQFTTVDNTYKITNIYPFKFINTGDNYEFSRYSIKECLYYFNNNDWTPIIPKPQNIELWI
jgi:hypothetical protein